MYINRILQRNCSSLIMKTTGLFFFLAIINAAYGFKVLAFLPFFAESHNKIGSSIARNLAEAGHDVTVLSCFPQKAPIKNYRDISIQDFLESFFKGAKSNMFDYESSSVVAPLMELNAIHGMAVAMTSNVIQHREVIKLLKSNEKFDVCLVEIFNYDALNLGVAEHFGCVLISYATYAAVKWTDDMTGNLSPYSYVPKPYLTYTDTMTFKQRLYNTIYSHVEDLHYGLFTKKAQRNLYNEFFPNAKRSFDEMYHSSAIIFMNTNNVASTPRPLMPNMIEIGGIHVQPAQQLPQDLQTFMDSAKDGVILFSMGTVLQSTDWAAEKLQAIIKAFGKLKQKVIWKYEDPNLPGKPDNVIISPWLPQRDLLAHPNLKLFITHGGLLGTTEALIEGIPLLGFPIFGDQKMNMAKAVERGYGLQIYFNDLTEASISQALNQLLSSKKYRENAKRYASLFNDRPMTPQQAVVYWTEYAVKHNGAPHLRSTPATRLNFFQIRSWDVYLLLIAIMIFAGIIKLYILRAIFRKICGGSKAQKEKRQ